MGRALQRRRGAAQAHGAGELSWDRLHGLPAARPGIPQHLRVHLASALSVQPSLVTGNQPPQTPSRPFAPRPRHSSRAGPRPQRPNAATTADACPSAALDKPSCALPPPEPLPGRNPAPRFRLPPRPSNHNLRPMTRACQPALHRCRPHTSPGRAASPWQTTASIAIPTPRAQRQQRKAELRPGPGARRLAGAEPRQHANGSQRELPLDLAQRRCAWSERSRLCRAAAGTPPPAVSNGRRGRKARQRRQQHSGCR